MSLRAKLEAVIYASEEPVTLAQLVGLLGHEAQAELDAAAAQSAELPLNEELPLEPGLPAATEAASAQEPAEPAEPAQTVDAGAAPAGSPTEADDRREAKVRERALREYFQSLLDALVATYAVGDRGLEIREVAGGYRFATKPEYHDAVRGFVKSLKPPLKLTLQALETLAVVAYKQPVTAPEVSEIRGVDSAGVLGSLMTRKLVQTAGRKQVIGRPMLYRTTREFLLRFGLRDVNELPSIEEFERMAGELLDDDAAQGKPVQGEISMADDAGGGGHEVEDRDILDVEDRDTPDVEDRDTPDVEERNAPEDPAAASTADSALLDEASATTEPTHILHDSPEDLMSDRSTSPEGRKHEPAGPAATAEAASTDTTS